MREDKMGPFWKQYYLYYWYYLPRNYMHAIIMPPPNTVWPEAYCFVLFVHVSQSVCPETLLTRYLAQYLTHFHQTYKNDAIWYRDEHITIWG